MNILLVNPSQETAYGKSVRPPDFFPMGLAYIGVMLKNAGHAVRFLDIDRLRVSDKAFVSILEEGRFDMVGITATSPTLKSSLRLAGLVKSSRSAKVVLGGPHPTMFADSCFESKDVDFVVRGEGEYTMIELVHALEAEGDPSGINGLSCRLDGKVRHNAERPPIEDLDGLPLPFNDDLIKFSYSFANELTNRAAPILISRGCPGRCTYCCTKKMHGSRIRYRTVGNIIGEFKFLKASYGIRELHIWDDNFITDKRIVFGLKDEMKRAGLSFKISLMNGVRVDFFSEEIAQCLEEMGVYSVGFGFESGNQRVLDNIKKGIRLDISRKAIAIAKRHGFETWGFFMLGLPGDDRGTIRETIEFAIELDPDIAKFHILKPFPGTEIYEELKGRGLLTTDDFERYGIHSGPVHRLDSLTGHDLIELQRSAYRRFYLRPKKILNQMANLKSPHRFMVNLRAAFSLMNLAED